MIPLDAVEIGLNSPRISDGASGLGSHRSIWLGAPESRTKMQFLAVAMGAPAARATVSNGRDGIRK